MKVRSKILAPVIVAAILGGIILSSALGLWKTTSSKVPVKFTSGEYAGENNPGDIRGSYSLGDISIAFDIEVPVLAQAFGLKDLVDQKDFQVKELENIYGGLEDSGEIGTDAVRLFVARYNGLPYTPEATTRIPAPALNLLKDKLSTADYDVLKNISVNLLDVKNSSESEEGVVKGRTTYNDLLSWGMTEKEIEDIIGMPAGPRSTMVREHIMEQGLEFFSYKEKLQAALDSR
jgi:hypothetical protein